MKRSLAVYDRDLARAIGMNEAILFEWLWFFLHSRRIEVPNGRVIEGRRWARFSYEALHLQSDLLDSQRTLIRTVNNLEKLGLLVARQSRDGKDYAIHFARLGEVIEPEHYQQYVAESNTDGLDDWDLFFEATPKPPKQVIKTSQNGQPQTNQNGYPEPVPDTPNPVGTLTNLATQTNQNGQPPIYKESITFSTSKDSTTTSANADDAKASPATVIIEDEILSMRELIWGMWKRLAHGETELDKEQRKKVGSAIDNTRNAYGEEDVYDALDEGRFEAWLWLTDDWFVQGKINQPYLLIKPFGWMVDYENKNGRDWYQEFTSKFPDWRVTAKGQYSVFRKAMPEMAKRTKETSKKTSSGLARWQTSPYGETPTAPTTKEDIADFRQKLRE